MRSKSNPVYTRALFQKGGWALFYFLAVFLSFPSVVAGQSEERGQAPAVDAPDPRKIWQEKLEFFMLHGQDLDMIETIEPASPLPERVWKKVFELASTKDHMALRHHLLVHYRESLPENGKVKEINALFFALASQEFQEILAKKYHDPSSLERLKVVLKTVKAWKESSLFYDVASFVAYPLTDIRQLSYQALAAMEDDRMFPLVLDLASSDDPIERTYAVDALYYIHDERTIPILLQLISDSNKSVRYYAIRTLEKMDANEAIPYYLKIIRSDQNNEVRVKAIEVISRKLPRGGFNLVSDTVADPNPDVREASVDAVVAYGFSSGAYALSDQLAREEVDHLKLKEIRAMIRLKSGGRMNGINRILKEESDPEILVWALYAAGSLSDGRVLDAVIALLEHDNEEVKIEAAFALASFGRSSAVKPLLHVILRPNESYEVKSAALYALGEIDSDLSVSPIFEISENQPNAYIRRQAKMILREMLARRYR